jgi:hypothetical protein
MAWTDLAAAFAYGSKLTSAQMQNLRDNVSAVPNGDAGAPQVQTAGIANGAVTAIKMSGNVGEVRLNRTVPALAFYEVLGIDGSWRKCCPAFNDT